MAHAVKSKGRLLARVRRIHGQTAALEAAIEAQNECLSILQQIAAIRGAVNGLMVEVLEGQIREHVAAEGLSAVERHGEVDQLAEVLRSYLK
ncbi:metal/formaldehyde-sensitive transcriptional repressor [Allopusillimonas ginsengisoli]|uniref:metal/formaldehyde-sensitive transcriptional repressor n=1 Tax=Allopusillimonas ginsengisoli TaxID=453575 RepID=UPI0039C3AC49